jgi:hypothetical protein
VPGRAWMVKLRQVFTYPGRVGRSEGGAVARSAASPAATRQSSSGRPCRRRDATIVCSPAASRMPAAVSEPELPWHQSTAWLRAGLAPSPGGERAVRMAQVSRRGSRPGSQRGRCTGRWELAPTSGGEPLNYIMLIQECYYNILPI